MSKTKAETVFEKLALSTRTVALAAERSEGLLKTLTGSKYKPKSFEEARFLKDRWFRKLKQRDALTEAANKKYLELEIKGKTKNFLKVRLP
jgi:hypothetical protein